MRGNANFALVKYYLNIGTNLGDREENIRLAIAKLAALSPHPLKTSTTVESEPWGFESRNAFLNVGVLLISDSEPHEMLARLQAIERELGSLSHRTATGDYADRLIDIDIMAIDNLEIHSPTLTVPHPYLHHRPFFLLPYQELLNS